MQNTLAEPKTYATSSSQQSADSELEALYTSLHRELWAMFYSFCHNAERATDAVQEAFLRFLQQDRCQIRNPRTWLQRVGHNWLRDVARSKGSNHAEVVWDFAHSEESSHKSVVRTEMRQIVQTGLDQLRELDRLVLTLRYGMNWPAARIAETLESTPQAVDMRLSRARLRLHDILIEQNPEFADRSIEPIND